MIKTKKEFEKAAKVFKNGKRMQWHPADEPPELDENHESDFILLNIQNFYTLMIGFYAEDEKGGAYYSYDFDVPLIEGDLFVTAWMPLPEKYEEE